MYGFTVLTINNETHQKPTNSCIYRKEGLMAKVTNKMLSKKSLNENNIGAAAGPKNEDEKIFPLESYRDYDIIIKCENGHQHGCPFRRPEQG